MKGRVVKEIMVKEGEEFPLRIVEEPHVGIIGKSFFLEEGLPEDIREAWGCCGCSETLHLVECAIREEWGQWGFPVSDAAAYVYRETVGHDNLKPLRHTSFTFYLDGVSLGALDAIASFPGITCTSWRIVPSTGMLEFVRPHGVHCGDEYEEWVKLCVSARRAFSNIYNESLNLKGFGESGMIARSVLPRCTATSAMATANAETWWHIIQKYRFYGSDPEIQKITQKIREILNDDLPACFSDLKAV